MRIKSLICIVQDICIKENMRIQDIWVRYCMKEPSDIVIFYYEPDGSVLSFSVTVFEETFNLQLIEAQIKLEIIRIKIKQTENVQLTIQIK